MRIAYRAIVVALVAALSFAAGAYSAIRNHWFQPLVYVTVVNASNTEIQSLLLSHESWGTKGQIERTPPKSGESVVIGFYPQGEGSFHVTAKLASGKELKGVYGYVEPGYRFTLTVTASEINIEMTGVN
jgi:hypothetical protein